MTSPAQDNDPIRRRRDLISTWTKRALRIGYLCFGISMFAVWFGLLWDFTPFIGSIATVALIGGSVLLAPAIVLGYAVKAAERQDKLDGT